MTSVRCLQFANTASKIQTWRGSWVVPCLKLELLNHYQQARGFLHIPSLNVVQEKSTLHGICRTLFGFSCSSMKAPLSLPTPVKSEKTLFRSFITFTSSVIDWSVYTILEHARFGSHCHTFEFGLALVVVLYHMPRGTTQVMPHQQVGPLADVAATSAMPWHVRGLTDMSAVSVLGCQVARQVTVTRKGANQSLTRVQRRVV
ncbi:hypothetical protein Tco_0178860 [Tanacetum coccineum]